MPTHQAARKSPSRQRDLHAEPAPFETVNQMLDAIKARYHCPSERKLAQLMDWEQSALRNYRKGRSSPNNAVALEIARKLDVDEGYVLLTCHAEREQDAHIKRLFQYLARQRSRFVGPALALALATFASPLPAPAHAGDGAHSLYILSNRRRRSIPVDFERRRALPLAA